MARSVLSPGANGGDDYGPPLDASSFDSLDNGAELAVALAAYLTKLGLGDEQLTKVISLVQSSYSGNLPQDVQPSGQEGYYHPARSM